jgi:Mor family transcriptional regulator
MPRGGPAKAPKSNPWGERRARAEEIARRFEEGESPADLAVRFGLTTDRVRDILRPLHDRQVSDSMLETALGQGDGAA